MICPVKVILEPLLLFHHRGLSGISFRGDVNHVKIKPYSCTVRSSFHCDDLSRWSFDPRRAHG